MQSVIRVSMVWILALAGACVPALAGETFRVACLEYSGHTGLVVSDEKMQVLYDGINHALAKQEQAGTSVDLIVTGETPTLMGSEETMDKMAQAIPGERTDKLGGIAAAHKVWLVADLLEWDAKGDKPRVYNSLVVFDRTGALVAKYRKVILPPEEVERKIQPGTGTMVIDSEFGRIGLLTCWEAQFPDHVAELMGKRPWFVVHPTAGDFRELLPYISRQYKVYFASASWSGPSIVVGPDGRILAEELYQGGKASEMKLAVADIPRGPGAATAPSSHAIAHSERPVVEMWDGGIYLARVEPSLLFAAWPDGRIVQRIGGHLKMGRVRPEAVTELLREIDAAGLFRPPVDYGIGVPDGPFRLIRARFGDQVQKLVYDGRTDFSDVGDHASPSKVQLKAFVRMWQRIEKAIAEMKPAKVVEETGDLDLKYPED